MLLRPLILAATILAQIGPPPMPPPITRFEPMAPAQAPADGISVSGTGYASAPATDAQVSLHVSARSNALTLNAQTLAPIVDALVRAGVDRSSILLPPYLVGPAHTNNATITATVRHPTLVMLQQGMATIAAAFAADSDVILNSADVRLSVDDCPALSRAAASNAIANARSNAAFIAQRLRKHVGPVLAVDARGVSTNVRPGCYTFYSIGPYGAQQPPLADLLTVRTGASVTMRFAIQP